MPKSGPKRIIAFSPTFCALPFVHMATSTYGYSKMCCVSENTVNTPENTPHQLGYERWQDVWNSPQMREARRRMLHGEQVQGCQTCYREEELGSTSLRNDVNQDWSATYSQLLSERIELALANDYAVEAPPVYLDLRLGNKCNLMCRSCSPPNSDQIQREYEKLAASNTWFQQNVSTGHVIPEISTWHSTEQFEANVSELLPELRMLYLTGGEPMLIEANQKLLQECVDRGFASKIKLILSTNLTTAREEFLNLLPHFEQVHLNFSIDAYGEEQEYLRHRSHWETMDRNLRKYLQVRKSNFIYYVTPVLQFHNALTITRLLDYVDSLVENKDSPELIVHPLLLHDPEYLRLDLLPDEAKALARDRLLQYLENPGLSMPDSVRPRFTQILTQLAQPRPSDFKVHRDRQLQFTKILDQSRGQNFAKTFPELSRMLKI